MVVLIALSEYIVCSGVLRPWHSTRGTLVGHAVGAVGAILWSLDHRWQLEFLIVRIVTFLSGIPLSISQDLFIQLYNLMHLISIRLRGS